MNISPGLIIPPVADKDVEIAQLSCLAFLGHFGVSRWGRTMPVASERWVVRGYGLFCKTMTPCI